MGVVVHNFFQADSVLSITLFTHCGQGGNAAPLFHLVVLYKKVRTLNGRHCFSAFKPRNGAELTSV